MRRCVPSHAGDVGTTGATGVVRGGSSAVSIRADSYGRGLAGDSAARAPAAAQVMKAINGAKQNRTRGGRPMSGFTRAFSARCRVAAAGTIAGMDYNRGVQIGVLIAGGIILLALGTCWYSGF